MRALLLVLLLFHLPAFSQQIKKQLADDKPVQAMSAAELAQLNDPLFALVLKSKPGEARLDEIEKLLMGSNGRRLFFVVDEHVADPTVGGTRRAVTGYRGVNKGSQLDPNVSLSMLITSQGIQPGFVEAWGWDDAKSRYNYYKLDQQSGEGKPSWKFRGSSLGADALTPAARAGTCFRCHINGAPVMKELLLPWNNWHSFKSIASYLTPTGLNHWSVADTARLADLAGAEDFESAFMLPAVKQFNGRRADALVRSAPGGLREVTDGPRLLRSLFVSTEYNLRSADQLSGLHPFPALGSGPATEVNVPDTFFLNANLLAGGGATQYQGLGMPNARNFSSVLRLKPAEYLEVVRSFQTKIGGKDFDANFAWFGPEASHVDNQMIDILVRRGIVTAEFAASALAVDLDNPVFSAARESLLRFVPGKFKFKPRKPDDVAPSHPDELTRTVIAAIRATPVAAGSPAEKFVNLLEDPAPLAKVKADVDAYLARETQRLADPAARETEIRRLYQALLDRRRVAQAKIPALVESQFLFPLGVDP